MNAGSLLAELAADGIRLSLAGENLRFQTRPGVSIDPHREEITANKPALLTLLGLQDEIVEVAAAGQASFDRRRYDRLWEEWHAHQAVGGSS